MARAIHIAVNLLLIVALTMQPGMAYAVQQDCSAGIAACFSCQGCGSCKVHLERAKCSCCSVEPADEQSGCCGHGDQHDEQHDTQHRSEDSTVATDPCTSTMLEEASATENPATENRVSRDRVSRESGKPSGNDHPLVRAVRAAVLASGCHCVSAPDPSRAPVPRSSAPELRDVLTVNFCCHDDAILTARPPLTPALDVAQLPVVDHFSQIIFCIWRL